MDLLSMLNTDDGKPAGFSKPVITSDPPPNSTASTHSIPQDGHPRDTENEDSIHSRKRPRVEGSPSPPTATVSSIVKSAPPVPMQGAPEPIAGQGGSPTQTPRALPTRSPTSALRSNSIIMLNDPPDGLEPSITNVQPGEELTRFISDFIFLNLNEPGIDTLEIEAKLGRIINVNTNERINLPVQTETVISNDMSEFFFHTRFESNMTEKQHKNFNQYLNQVFMESRPQSNGAGHSTRRIPISYKHTKQIDSIYGFPHESNDRGAQKIRVTTNTQGEVLATIVKDNLGHLNIYSPRTAFDWRVSINNERRVQLQPGMEIKSERRKDRLTYIHQHCQIDLTQVIHPAERERSHELEVELSDIDALKVEAENAKAGRPSKYSEMVRVFVDNVRLLARLDKG